MFSGLSEYQHIIVRDVTGLVHLKSLLKWSLTGGLNPATQLGRLEHRHYVCKAWSALEESDFHFLRIREG